MNKALFLDRDGVINKLIIVNNKLYPVKSLDELEILPNVDKALQEAKKLGLVIIVFTNQPDIARKTVQIKDVEEIHNYLMKRFPIDDIFMCPHDDNDNCNCRKPKPGMLFESAKKFNIDLKKSFVVGDRWKDIVAGKSAGCITFLINSNYFSEETKSKQVDYDYCVDDLYSAVKIISKLLAKERKLN